METVRAIIELYLARRPTSPRHLSACPSAPPHPQGKEGPFKYQRRPPLLLLRLPTCAHQGLYLFYSRPRAPAISRASGSLHPRASRLTIIPILPLHRARPAHRAGPLACLLVGRGVARVDDLGVVQRDGLDEALLLELPEGRAGQRAVDLEPLHQRRRRDELALWE